MTEQEISLLYHYTSSNYLIKLRDTWGALVAHVEKCLREFESNLPSNYRARALPQQPDIVWGGRVLPNFRDTYHALCEGCVLLLAGDVRGLRACHGPLSDFKGQTDFDPSWMSAADLDRYGDLLGESVQIASNIRHTEGANWDPFTLSTEYDTLSRGPLPPQVDTYTYQVRSQTTVTTGNMPEISGVYIPDVEVSCPQFLVSYRAAPPANVFMRYDDLLHPETGEKYGEAKVTGRRNCTWALVEPQDASGV